MLSKYLPLACIALAFAGTARAQETDTHRFTVSAGGAYERSVFGDGVLLSAPLVNNIQCPITSDGDGTIIGYDIRASTTYSILPSFEAGTRFEFSRMKSNRYWYLPDAAVLLEGSGGIPVNQSITWHESFTMETARLDLFAHYTPTRGIAFEAGLTLAHRHFTQVRRTQELSEPANARFKNPNGLPSDYNGRMLILYNGTWPESKHFVPGALIGISGAIPVIDGFSLVPELLLRKEFTPPSDEASWPSFFASAGISAAYTF